MTSVCIIRPPTILPYGAVTTSDAVPPLGVAYLASAVRAAGIDVSVVDAVGHGIDNYARLKGTPYLAHGLALDDIVDAVPAAARVIGVSCMFSNEWFLAKQLLTRLRGRFPDALLVAGGEAVTADPKYTFESCDAVDACVLGEGELTFVALIEALDLGEPLDNVPGVMSRAGSDRPGSFLRRHRIRRIDDIEQPAWDLLPIEAYLSGGHGMGAAHGRAMPLLASRGCPYECTFCSNPQMWGRRWVARTPAFVLQEILTYISLYNANHFQFYDLTAIVKQRWIVEFCNLLIERNLDITWSLPSGTRSEAIDGEVASLLMRSGCRSMTYAPESGSEVTIQRIKKKVDLPRMLASMSDCVRNGITVKANIIFGFPEQRKREAFPTFAFIAKMAAIGVHDVAVFPFVAYPGSELFEQLVEENRIDKNSAGYERFLSDNIYNQVGGMISWSEYMSTTQLKFLTVGGMGYFYLLSFLIRPWRPVVALYNMMRGTPVTMFERALFNIFKRRFAHLILAKDVNVTNT